MLKFTIRSEQKKFNRFINWFIRKSEEDAGEATREIMHKALSNIVKKWPVNRKKTLGGRSREAWVVSLKKLSGKGLNVPRLNYANTVGKEVRAGKKFGKLRKRLKRTKKPWITVENRVPYAIHLEYGHSRQMPHGVVRKEIRKGMRRQVIKKILFKHLRTTWEKGW